MDQEPRSGVAAIAWMHLRADSQKGFNLGAKTDDPAAMPPRYALWGDEAYFYRSEALKAQFGFCFVAIA